MSNTEWHNDQAIGEAAMRRLEKLPALRLAALKQIAKACRDLRRNANLDDSPDFLAFLEEIEAQLEELELHRE